MLLQTVLIIDPKYGEQDPDTNMVLTRWQVMPSGSRVLEVGCHDEHLCRILADNGYDMYGIDLRADDGGQFPLNFTRIQGDFVQFPFAPEAFDMVVSTSALEHFGLGTYGEAFTDPEYDRKAASRIHEVLKPGGVFHCTVPYWTHDFLVSGGDFRLYDQKGLTERIIGEFEVEEQQLFKSAGYACPDDGGNPPLVKEEDTRALGPDPHLGVFLKLRKR